jgi:hypothetical protein
MRKSTVSSQMESCSRRWLEQHGATEPVAIQVSGRQRITGARRRIAVAAVDRALHPLQREAWEEAEKGYLALVRALGVRTASLEARVDCLPVMDHNFDSAITSRFIDWGTACLRAKPPIDYDACRSVLFDGRSFASVDRAMRWRNGTAACHVKRSLDLWIVLRRQHLATGRCDSHTNTSVLH